MVDDRLSALDKVLANTKNTPFMVKCSLGSCRKLYTRKHLRERYCSDKCRVLAQKLSNKRSKKKKRNTKQRLQPKYKNSIIENV